VADNGLTFEAVSEQQELPHLIKRPTNIGLFRFSSVTWNAHRIHYDKDWAQHEGYPDVLVQAHLHGSYLTQMVMDWIGPTGILSKISWRNRRFATPQNTLTCKGRVVKKFTVGSDRFVECEIWEENEEGEVCASGMATVLLPSITEGSN
jgi:hydroxyacyl-ACP dehydratase HTD2-like protein with hotdog domain